MLQDSHNQAGIAHRGGIISLLNLLDVKTGSVQHNAAFALYGLADNEVSQTLTELIFDIQLKNFAHFTYHEYLIILSVNRKTLRIS